MVHHGRATFLRVPSVLAVAALCAGLAGGSCSRMPLTAPSGSALTLISSANLLSVTGSADITAVVIEGAQSAGSEAGPGEVTAGVGTPVHNGTLVVFTTSLGRIEPSEARTSGGRVTVKLIGDGRSGTATITAFSGAANNTLEVDIGAAGATRVAVTASPQTLPPAGGTSTISARIEDQQGNGVGGVTVSFSTSKGTLNPTTDVTNSQGFATTTLTTTAEATVTASTGGSATSLNGTVLVTLKPATTIGVTPPASAMLGVPATFTITPGTDTLITRVDVDFGDGSDVSLGALSSATNVSHIFREAGDVTVTVRATDSEGGVTEVATSVAVVPLTATGTATPSSATEPEVHDTVTFTVTTVAGAAVDEYRWNFGDGTTKTTESNSITHRYATSGSKVVTVRVYPFGSDEYTTVLISVRVW